MDRSRHTLLPLAARTGAATPIQLLSLGCEGVIIYLNVTASSGTGGLIVQLRGFDNEGNAVVFYASPSSTAATRRVYICSPWNLSAAANGITAVQGVPLPYRFDVNVTHADGSSYTYSLAAETF